MKTVSKGKILNKIHLLFWMTLVYVYIYIYITEKEYEKQIFIIALEE